MSWRRYRWKCEGAYHAPAAFYSFSNGSVFWGGASSASTGPTGARIAGAGFNTAGESIANMAIRPTDGYGERNLISYAPGAGFESVRLAGGRSLKRSFAGRSAMVFRTASSSPAFCSNAG